MTSNIVEGIVRRIYDATVLVADLTFQNPNVLYELGVANALSKECVMICQVKSSPESSVSSWVISREGNKTGKLPFDLESFRVIDYTNDEEGRRMLKRRLVDRLSVLEPLRSPVNLALDEVLNRNRIAGYVFAGALGGLIIGFLASLLSAFLGESILWTYHSVDTFFRTIFEGTVAGLYMGAPALGAYAIVHNRYRHQLSRPVLIVAEVLGGVIGGALIGSTLFFLDVRGYGVDVVASSALALGLVPILGGVALGFALNTQIRREAVEPLAVHLLRAFCAFAVTSIVTVSIVHLFKDQIFALEFVQNYDILDIVSEVLRYSVWGIVLSLLQRYLRPLLNQ